MKQLSRYIFLCFLFWGALNSVTSCPPIQQKKGVVVECKLNGTIVDCGLKEIPEGTIASFSCGKFYFREKSPHQGEMECTEIDGWEYLTDYEDFNCQIQCGVTSRVSPVIVGGSHADKYDFPWHAAIFLRNTSNDLFDLQCGGSLIDLNDQGPLILTAAHCLVRGANLADYRVVLGASTSTFLQNKGPDSQIFGVSFYEVYPSYNSTSLENDIAVMKLSGDPELSDGVKPICLERGSHQTKSGDIGIVAGFGLTEERIVSMKLLYAALPVRDHEECARKIPAKSGFAFPTGTKFCAGFFHKDNAINGSNDQAMNEIVPGICFGDSGGGFTLFDPARKRSTLVGIAHAAFNDGQLTCSGVSFFQSVGKYIGWIREVQKIVHPSKKTSSTTIFEGVGMMGSRCGSNPDWVEYKDEKCFRLVKQLATKADASKICAFGFEAGNSLPILKSSEEHDFLIKLLEQNRIRNGIWLGATRGPLGYRWDNWDGMEKFSKWAPNGNSGVGNCSIIQPRSGHWVEEDCETENIVVCQKIQEFSNAELLQTIISLKANINESRLELKADIEKVNEKFESLNTTLSTFIEKLSSSRDVDSESILLNEPVKNNSGRRILGLRTGTWYTFSNKAWNAGLSYMSWMLDGTIKFGQLTYNTGYVNKYKSGHLDGQWMIRKTSTPGSYTLYNRGAKGYLIKYTNDNYLWIVEETELIPDDGHWCFTEGTESLSNSVRIHLCKATKDGKGSLRYDSPSTVEGYKLKLYPIDLNGNVYFWSVNLVGST